MRSKSMVFGVWLASVLLFSRGGAAGEPESLDARTVARRMAEEAANLYDEGRYEEARNLFHRADALYPAPTLELWEARALNKLGRLVEAEEHYAFVQRYEVRPDDPEIVRAAVREASEEVDNLRRRIPTITLVMRGAKPDDPAVQVDLDAARVSPALIGFPIPVDPGARLIRCSVNGREALRMIVTLTEGDRKPVELDLSMAVLPPRPSADRAATASATTIPGDRPVSPAALPGERSEGGLARPSEPPWYVRSTAGWVAAGIGVAGLAVGAGAGIVAISKHNSLEQHCPEARCQPNYGGELDSFRTARALSTAGYIVGAVGLAAGLAVLVLAPAVSAHGRSVSAAVELTPASAMLTGEF